MQEFDPITGAPITPMNNAAMLAGGSKPMTAMDNPYQTGQANMNPNFIGNYSGPTTGMLAQEKIANLQPQIPLETSIVLNNIKSATDSGKDNVEGATAAKGAKMPTGMVTQDRSDSTAIFMAGTAPGQFNNPSWKAAADSAKKANPNIDADKIKSSDIYKPTKFAPDIENSYGEVSKHLPVVNERYGIKQDKKMKDYLLTGVTVDAEVSTKNPMNVIGPNKDLANFRPTKVKPDSENPGIEGEQSPKSVVLNHNEVNDAKLDERKRNSRVQHGAQANRDESFRRELKKRSAALGVPDPVDSILNQDKLEDKMRKERYRESIINTDFGSKVEAVKGVNYTPNPNPEKNYEKGFEPFGPLSGQPKSISSRKINGNTVLGGNQPTKKSGLGAVVQQNKKMPTGPEGKGIRGLATSVQENMGYDPLSQERLTQSRRGTKCMRVKRK